MSVYYTSPRNLSPLPLIFRFRLTWIQFLHTVLRDRPKMRSASDITSLNPLPLPVSHPAKMVPYFRPQAPPTDIGATAISHLLPLPPGWRHFWMAPYVFAYLDWLSIMEYQQSPWVETLPALKQERSHGESEGANFVRGFLSDVRFAHVAGHCFNSGALLCTGNYRHWFLVKPLFSGNFQRRTKNTHSCL